MTANAYKKDIKRTILGSIGRYVAILAIIALGVGFFVGVKDTRAAMLKTCNKYLTEYKLYDYRLLSNYGFKDEDATAFQRIEGVRNAEGAISCDFFSQDMKGNSVVLRAHSLTDSLNRLKLIEGRLPKNNSECVVDEHFIGSKFIGKKIRVSEENDKDIEKSFNKKSYKIVGIVRSPYYILKTERGTTSLGDGKISGFLYLNRDCFTSQYYTEMLLTCKKQGYVFSDEYNSNIKAMKGSVKEAAEARGSLRVVDLKAEAQKKIDEGQEKLNNGKRELERKKNETFNTLEASKTTLDSKKEEIRQGKAAIASKRSELVTQKNQTEVYLEGLRQNLAQEESMPNPNESVISRLQGQIAQAEGGLVSINEGLSQLTAKEGDLISGEEKLRKGYYEYRAGRAKAETEFVKAEAELKVAESDLDNSRRKLADLEKPEIYIQTRDDNGGYSNFESNSEIVDGIAKIFPIFFFLIAALVCSTTMTRMIEEERTQIGALRALGYTRGQIMWKYMVYSGSAAVIGCVGGFLAGSKYFPIAIWTAYSMMFGFADLEFHFNGILAIVSLAVSLICSVGTTYFACRGQLKGTPAEILRPGAPKAGKRIFLEKITFLWSRLKFLHKVSARNVFRYKKRMFMMILGIAGCTALIIAGFGINDSVAGLARHQYSKVETYDASVIFSKAVDDEKYKQFKEEYSHETDNVARVQQIAVKGSNGKDSKQSYLMITDDKNITGAMEFKNKGRDQKLPGYGEALISDGLADKLGLEKKDTIIVKYDETKKVSLTISGIYENFVNNYIYVSDKTYCDKFNKDYEPILLLVSFDSGEDIHQGVARVNKFDGVTGSFLNADTEEQVNRMMDSLNFIVILVIFCAGALAFIVLFNLSNINITEREREIATIKVLGFYPRETGSYVFRENLVLTALGIVVGLPLGYILHGFIMHQIVVDIVSFNSVVEVRTYFYTVFLVIGFSIIVDIIMRRKLKRINMAEALKSIE